MGEIDLAAICLDVHETQDGHWNPDHGDVEVPPGWEFLASGDAFMTRRVKAAGRYWLAWLPRTRSRQHRRLVGLWAPKATIDEARAFIRHRHTDYERNLDAVVFDHDPDSAVVPGPIPWLSVSQSRSGNDIATRGCVHKA